MGERSALRFPTILLGLVCLVLGLWAGLLRLGWGLPIPDPSLAEAHGTLMVNGVLATLIGLERAVALGRRSFYSAPAMTAAGSIALAVGLPGSEGIPLLVLGSAVTLAMFLVILRRLPAIHTLALASGAACLVAGNLLWWNGADIPLLIPWWGSFLVLVIAAERLELTRIVRISRQRRAIFVGGLGLDLMGCVLSLESFSLGCVVLALSWAILATWLLIHDVAWMNLSRPGLPRFTAVCLIAGYGWLAAGSLLILGFGGIETNGLVYDAQLHAVFLGFVLSLVFAHAPIILPAVTGRPLPFHPVLYAAPVILNISVAARVLADLKGYYLLREWAGLFNAVAIVLFGLCLLAILLIDGSNLRRALQTGASGFFP